MKARLVHIDGHTALAFDSETQTVTCGERSLALADAKSTEILSTLVTNGRRITTYKELEAKVLLRHGVGTNSSSGYVHKKISGIRKGLRTLGVRCLIKTKKGEGYVLSDEWQVDRCEQSLQKTVLDAVEFVCTVCDDAKKLMNQLAVIESEHGQVLDLTDCQQRINDLARRYEHAARSALSALQHCVDVDSLMQCSSILRDLESYVRMARIGSGLTESQWKQSYRREITQLCDALRSRARQQERGP